MSSAPDIVETKQARWAIIAAAIASFAACTLLDLFYFPATTTFPDEARFIESAERLIATGEFSSVGFRAWEMPGTALFYAAILSVFPGEAGIYAIRIVQASLVALQVTLVASIARRLYGERAAVIAAFIAGLYPFFLFYQGTLLSETLFTALLVASFASLFWWRDRGARIDAALVSTVLLFAAAGMTKPTLTILPPLLLASAAWGRGIGRIAQIGMVAGLLYCALMAPWWARNYAVLGTFIPFTTSAGENFYLGNSANNPEAGIDWTVEKGREPATSISANRNEVERMRAFTAAAVTHILNDPAGFLVRAGKKFARFWNIIPNATEYRSPLFIAVAFLSFAPILLLAIIGVSATPSPSSAPVLLLVLYFTALHMITIASLRYRLPIEPFLIVLASNPLASMVSAWSPATFPVALINVPPNVRAGG